jgi:hypothetical protein
VTGDSALQQEARDHARALGPEARELEAAVPLERLVAELDGLSGAAAGALRPGPAARLVERGRATFGASATGACAKRLVLRLIEDHPSRLRRLALPDAVRELYPSTLRRIAHGIAGIPHEAYVAASGDFWRDLRLASQLTVPLTASRVLDRIAFLPRSFYRDMGLRENLRCLRSVVLRLHGLGPLFRVHIDERDLSEFDEAGWDRAYLRAAEMLRLYPKTRGTVGTSWTLDPQLDRLSPRLSYARQCQLDHGAFLRREGPSELTTQRALAKSSARRRAYERGEYVPTTYTIVWPRRDLLRWADGKAPAR